jgi:hypothetical protein
MKKLFMLLTLCAFIATSCDKSSDVETTKTTPEITVAKDHLSMSSGNGMGSISYSITNPVDGLSVEANANVEWIHSFKDSNNKIDFSISATDLYEERTGIITLTYGDANASVTITQAGKQKPNEVEETAPFLIGEYYGDYAGANYNYYIALSSSDYDASNPLYAPGWKYFLDIYASVPPTDYTNIRIPNGVYTLNTNNDGKAGTFLSYYSIYKEYNSNGIECAKRVYKSGKLTVSDNLVKLEVTFTDGTDMHIVSYSGDYTILDMRTGSNN